TELTTLRVHLDDRAVRNHPVLAGEVRRNELARGARDRDALIELVHVTVERDAPGPVREGEPAERVERRDVRALRGVEDLKAEERHERLVVMDDVELLAVEHARDQPFKAQ